MSIFDLDPAGQRALDEQARLNPYDPTQGQAGFFTGMLQGLGEGVMRGGAKAGGLIPLASEQAGNDYRLNLALANPDTDVLRPLPTPFTQHHDALEAYHNAVDYWTPGASEVGTAGNVLGGLGEMVLPLAAGAGNPALLASSETVGTTLDLSRQGVDPSASADVGAIQGASTLVGFGLPAAIGRNLITRVATGAAGNLIVGRAAGYGAQARLNASGDTKAAEQFDPWNAQSVVLDVLMGTAFGGIHHLQARGTDATPLPRQATQAERDAVLAASNAAHFQNETMPGRPENSGAVVAHQRALETAIDQALRGEPVDVAGKVDLGQFETSIDPMDAPNFGLPEAPRPIAPEDPFWQSIPEGKNGRETANIDTPERQALRDQLVEEHFTNAAPPRPAGERPVAYVMGGGGASGKGTLLAQLQASDQVPRGIVHVDPDAIKAGEHGISGIPEYRQMVDRGDSRAAAVVHEESSQIATAVKDRAMAERRDFVLDRTLGNPTKAAKEIRALKDAGYEVRLFGVTLDAGEAIKRAVKRAQGKGRYVPLKDLLKAHKGFASGFEDYAKLADHALLFDNTTEPRVIAQTQDGKLQIINESGYNQFRARRSINDQASTHRELAAEAGADARLREESDQPTGMGGGQGGKGSGGAGVGRPQRLEAGDRGTGAPQGGHAGLDPKAFPVLGKASTVITERGLQLPVRWAVADASQLITSHDDALNVNPDFPAELQPRDRSRAASEQQIARIANAINPELLAESPKASDGAPVVGADRVVESGNARTIALRRAYASGKADTYRAFLLANAERFGLDPAKLADIEQPVLVRVTEGDYNRAEFARQANESTVAAMSTTEQALADASHLPDMGELHTRDDGSIDMRASAKFVHGFIEGIGPNERGAMSTADGELSQQGQARIRNAVFARAYGDPELVAMMAEATDANVKNVLAGMLRAAPAIARLREMIAEGGRFGPDISPDLVSAVRKFSQLRRDGLTVAQFEAQGDFFGEGGLTPRARDLLHTVGENARAPKRMAEFIQRYVEAVDALGDPRQADMLGAGAGDRADAALRKASEATRAANDTPAPQAGNLFNAAGRPSEAAAPAITPENRAAYEAIAANPDLHIIDDNGNPVPAAEFLAAAEADAAAALDTARGVEAAATCLLRNIA